MVKDINNQVQIRGRIASEFMFDHESREESIYVSLISVKRYSGREDLIPIMVTKSILDSCDIGIGKYVSITGRFHSYNIHTDKKLKVRLNLSVDEIYLAVNDEGDKNYILLNGYLCRKPNFRKLPSGKEMAGFLIAVNRNNNRKKADYIPCISWGVNARNIMQCRIGTPILIQGRIQSREYPKFVENEKRYETHTTYEVSISEQEIFENEKK